VVTQNLLYLDPWSGLSGDMMLAALVDAGGQPAESELHRAVGTLGLRDVVVDVKRDSEWGIACTRVDVHLEKSPPLRRLSDMLDVIERAAVSERVKAQARAAIIRLGDVEAKIHGCPVDQIHFHEVGAADTLVDVVGTFVLVEALGVEKVFVGPIPVGSGAVEIAHGRMGVPAPATVALLSGYEIRGGAEARELTTPTGALLVGQLEAVQGPLPAMTVRGVGYGAGSMKLEQGPNLLRLVMGEAADADVSAKTRTGSAAIESVVELQTNIDDVSAEVVGYTLRRLRQAGALDAWAVAAQMKKDRPGFVLHLLTDAGKEAELVDILFSETGTLGVRRSMLSRHIADRGAVSVSVAGHEVSVKWGRRGGCIFGLAPEYEDAAAAAAAAGLPLREVMRVAGEAARRQLEQGEQR
jgi:uncharacterized protein (TIGR00299 family) protein